MMRVVTVVLIAGILAVAGCKHDPEQAANKLLVETTTTWQQYLALGVELDATQYAARLALLKGIAANLETLQGLCGICDEAVDLQEAIADTRA